MKGIIIYSSNTGNTKLLAEKIYEGVKESADWTLSNITEKVDTKDFDVVLLGGWAENGSLNKATLEFFNNIEKENKKIGLFMTMGSRTSTEHGKVCENNLNKLLEGTNSLGIKLMQGKISQALMDKIATLPDTVLPKHIKDAMQDGVDSYKEPSNEDYKEIADFFLNQIK